MCYTNNVFMKVALELLHFDVEFISGSVSSPHAHIMTLVRNVVRKGDSYLVDVGGGYPTLKAIDMNFESATPIMKQYGYEYQIAKAERPQSDYDSLKNLGHQGSHQIYERIHKLDRERIVPSEDLRGRSNDWFRFYHFSLAPRHLDFFGDYTAPVYEDTGVGPFHKCLAITLYDNNVFSIKTCVTKDDEGNDQLVMVIKNGEKETRKLNLGLDHQVDDSEIWETEFLKMVKENVPSLSSYSMPALKNFKDIVFTTK